MADMSKIQVLKAHDAATKRLVAHLIPCCIVLRMLRNGINKRSNGAANVET